MGNKKNLVSGTMFIAVVLVLTVILNLPQKGCSRFSREERRIIRKSDSVMYVLNLANREDSLFLRTKCEDFADAELHSRDYFKLARKMLRTVKSDCQGGVGLAAPQVGISHRIIAVCRVDKEGEPFELYTNVRIDSLFGEVRIGAEGCLSVPPYRGNVPRYSDVIISYKNVKTMLQVSEHVSGYAAVIFQHECDHLDGVLYTDKADSIHVNTEWAKERVPYKKMGLYKRPEWFHSLR